MRGDRLWRWCVCVCVCACHTDNFIFTCRTNRDRLYDTNIPLNLPRFRLYLYLSAWLCLILGLPSLLAFLCTFSERDTPKCHTGLFVYDSGGASSSDTNHRHRRIQCRNHCLTRISLKRADLIASCINIQHAIVVYSIQFYFSSLPSTKSLRTIISSVSTTAGFFGTYAVNLASLVFSNTFFKTSFCENLAYKALRRSSKCRGP